MGEYGATCAHTLTTETRDLDKSTWDETRFGWVCESSDSFADWKAVIEKLCSVSGRCTYQEKQLVQNFFLRMTKINRKAQARLQSLKENDRD
jgi:hypothetical protein